MTHTTIDLANRILLYTDRAHTPHAHHSYSTSSHHADGLTHWLSRVPEMFANAMVRAFAWKSVGALFRSGAGTGFLVLAAFALIGGLIWLRLRRTRT